MHVHGDLDGALVRFESHHLVGVWTRGCRGAGDGAVGAAVGVGAVLERVAVTTGVGDAVGCGGGLGCGREGLHGGWSAAEVAVGGVSCTGAVASGEAGPPVHGSGRL